MSQLSIILPPWSYRGRTGESSANFSRCEQHGDGCSCPGAAYRYELRRIWDKNLPPLIFVGLNPSTADAAKDDPTIRRILGYAMDWGFGELLMLNIFAWRSTDRRALKVVPDPVGGLTNNRAIIQAFVNGRGRSKLLLGWGEWGTLRERGAEVTAWAHEHHGRPECLGKCANGQPKHPLYLAASLIPRLV